MVLAAAFLFLYAVILTLSPVLRYRSWQVDLRWIHWIGLAIISSGFFFLQHVVSRCRKNYDTFLFPIIYLLSGWGLLTISRLNSYFGLRQTAWILAALLTTLFLVTCKRSIVPYLEKYALLGLILGIAFLAATMLWGSFPGGNGPALWLRILGVNVQPSEFLKLLFIIYLSAKFAGTQKGNRKFKTIIPSIFFFLLISAILIWQNDFGTTLIFLLIYATYLYFYTGKTRVFGLIVLSFLLLAVIGYQYFDIFSTRISAWLLPWDDPTGGAYQVVQSILSIAAGGIIGSGPGLGFPNVVPLAHSDFIFSAIAEETGLLGTSCFIILLAILLWRGYKNAHFAPTPFQGYIAAGVTTYLITQSILIIGGTIRLLPITGVTLPFVSYGGSSYISVFLAISMLYCTDIPARSGKKSTQSQGPLDKPIKVLGTIFLITFFIIECVLFWWSYIQADGLQNRSDNPRLIYADQYVRRGTIYDRNGIPLAITEGESGSYYRYYLYSDLSNTVGFSHTRYGRSGIEEKLNGYLRGYAGYPATTIWFNHLVYDQPPTGIDVHLTLDLDTQQQLDAQMAAFFGAGIVLDAESGEILAIASHPSFDANTLTDNWNVWNNDESAPFLNRVMQGAYPAGGILTPFLITQEKWDEFSNMPLSNEISSEEDYSACFLSSEEDPTFSVALRNGCNFALLSLLSDLSSKQIQEYLTTFGFFSHPTLGVPLSEVNFKSEVSHPIQYIVGNDQIRFSPLMVAKAASLISNNSENIPLKLILDPTEAVIESSSGSFPNSFILPIQFLLDEFFQHEGNAWLFNATSSDENGVYQWSIRGTYPQAGSKRTIIVIVLENGSAENARAISTAVYDYILKNQS